MPGSKRNINGGVEGTARQYKAIYFVYLCQKCVRLTRLDLELIQFTNALPERSWFVSQRLMILVGTNSITLLFYIFFSQRSKIHRIP